MELKKVAFLFILVALSCISIWAQDCQQELAKKFILAEAKELNFTTEDLAELLFLNCHHSKHNAATHFYFQQTRHGIPIYNAIWSLAVKNGELVYSSQNFTSDITSKVASIEPQLKAEEALLQALKAIGIASAHDEMLLVDKHSKRELVFNGLDFSNSDVPCRLVYETAKDGKLHLVWQFDLDMKTSADYWCIGVDARDGKIRSQFNYNISCTHGKNDWCNHSRVKRERKFDQGTFTDSDSSTEWSSASLIASSYKVFAFPTESPIHGDQSIEICNNLSESSPFGWHDTDGIMGPEYTITRGNNVWAFADVNDDDLSDGNEPDGGPSLEFLFDYNANEPNVNQLSAAQTQLFYSCNWIHDISYHLGFTPEAGNFQNNNYGLGGEAGDELMAQAQDGSEPLLNTNNANFLTLPDGTNSRIQMFLWGEPAPPKLLNILSPAWVQGVPSVMGVPAFGIDLQNIDTIIMGSVVLVDDGIDPATDGCSDIQNDIKDKIALIDRGGCVMTQKVYFAQKAEAIGAIICNNLDTPPPNMGISSWADSVDIPSVHLAKSLCDSLKDALSQNLELIVEFGNFSTAGILRDSDFDNGIIAHEYAHGISNRLTGGGSTVSCLANQEQMGEGWSDFFALALTAREGDLGTDERGLGNFVQGLNVEDDGIRDFPYTTDMSINALTYGNMQEAAGPYDVGEIWCSMLWEMYWNFIDEYGFDSDYSNTESGNFLAMQLVIDGMKLQPCFPGFVDARDAILAADQINNDGANACIIWEAFAKRGLGYYADQGDSDLKLDGTENFTIPGGPNCLSSVEEAQSNQASFNVFPNPANHSINIEISSIQQNEFRINILSTDGKVVRSINTRFEFGESQEIDVSQFSKGIYLIEISNQQAVYSEKLIIN